MLEWIFLKRALMDSRWGGWYGSDLRIPILLIDNLFIWLGGRMYERLPLLGAEAKRINIYGAGYYLQTLGNWREEPTLQC